MTVRQVIEEGFCIGCGACKSIVSGIGIQFNRFGDLVARVPTDVTEEALARADQVCPFAATIDETQLAVEAFGPPAGGVWHGEIGMHRSTLAAYAPAFRAAGSSGGMATWLMTELLERGLIDGVIHVGASFDRPDGRRFSFRVSTTPAAVATGSTSFYYPVSMDEVLAIVGAKEGRYAITGIPCFQKALRLLRRQDPVLDRRIRYQIGIVCGQMKSAHYVDYLAATAGAAGTLTDACFRRKVDGYPADDYAFEARFKPADGAGTEGVARVMNSRIGVNWGMGYFKPSACDFCDDVLAETADVAVMDAWLPEYVRDGKGWSLVVVRTPELAALHEEARVSGLIVSQTVSAEQVADSQRGGFNHRRAALAYRLWLRRDRWAPVKRIPASASLPPVLKLEQRLREWLRQRSRRLWISVGRPNGITAFRQRMRWPERIYKLLQRTKRKLRIAQPAPRHLIP